MDILLLTLSLYALAALLALGIALLIRTVVVLLARAPVPPAARPATPPAATTRTGPPPEHIAAISAAVAAVMGPHHIVHIEHAYQRSWAIGGRSLHHSSHNLARRSRR